MATRKSYAYQIKGNKISLLENQFGYGSGQDVITVDGSSINHKQYTLDEIGPTGKPSWVSPTSDVTNGIEIEYTYSPIYQLPELKSAINQFGIIGWTVVDGYLTFLDTGEDWTSGVNVVVGVDEYIYIGDSSRWTGIHKVQEVQSYTGVHGGIKTYTKVNESIKYFFDSSVDFTVSETVTGLDTNFNDEFTSNTEVPYIWITGSDGSAANNGLFSGWSFDNDTQVLTLTEWHYYENHSERTVKTIVPVFVADTSERIDIREAFYDPCYLVSDASIMEDESFELDLPPYLSKALVYYVKAKFAEDQMDIERKEYFMREFKKLVEKHESSKITGPRRIMGFGMTR